MKIQDDPKIIATEVSKECRELLKEIIRQNGKIVDMLTLSMVYIPKDCSLD